MIVYLSLGANLGNREQTIDRALELLSEQIGPLIKRSSFYYSEPWGFESPNEFCNICASFDTHLSPLDLLQATQAIERQLGRKKKTQSDIYEDRAIDIDIIRAFDDDGKEIHVHTFRSFSEGDKNCQLSTVNYLIVPHQKMAQRPFVTVPLNEIMQENA